EQLEHRVHRAGARSPRTVGLVLEPLDHVVAVTRLLAQDREHGGAEVASPHAAPASALVTTSVWHAAPSPGAFAAPHGLVSPVSHLVPPKLASHPLAEF